jgi:hypothetical protein
VKPDTFVYFRVDRLCTRCPTYYSPPTPVWAALLFFLLGNGLAGLAIPLVLHQLRRGPDACGLFWTLLCSVIGVMCMVQGAKYLFVQKRVKPPQRAIPVEPVGE